LIGLLPLQEIAEEKTLTKKTLIEVSVSDSDGNLMPFGIMNTDQAAELSDDSYHKIVAHPAVDEESSQDEVAEI
jgi:hypothetical protein